MKKLLVVSALCLPLCGCARWLVPTTVIKGSIAGQPFYYSGPKNQIIGMLKITASTNGTVSITVSNLDTKMDPAIVQMSGQVFVDSINAIGTQVVNGMAAGGKAAVVP